MISGRNDSMERARRPLRLNTSVLCSEFSQFQLWPFDLEIVLSTAVFKVSNELPGSPFKPGIKGVWTFTVLWQLRKLNLLMKIVQKLQGKWGTRQSAAVATVRSESLHSTLTLFVSDLSIDNQRDGSPPWHNLKVTDTKLCILNFRFLSKCWHKDNILA